MTLSPFLQRIIEEHRRYVVPLAILGAINLLVLMLVLFPLSSRVRAAADRAAGATARREAAHLQEQTARRTLEGKRQATGELQRFYTEILPVDQSQARRVTYLRLAQMASQAGLRYERRSFTPEEERDSRLRRLDLTMVLEGEYPNIRRFIHALETSPEFIVIRDVSLAQREGRDASLTLTLDLSTYYLPHGS